MKIDRLIGILSILLQQERVTAPYLTEIFEVSRRTINRDIEDLCKAGIPLVTSQGKKGGISIMEGFRMDRTVLTSEDMRSILAGLKSLDSVSGSSKYQQLMEKLTAGQTSKLETENNIRIDLSSWYKSSLPPKIGLIKEASASHRMIAFRYFSSSGEGVRKIEPYYLIFQWSSWYVWGYCTDRQDYRLFKLNRLTELKLLEETFEPRELPEFDMAADAAFPIRFWVKGLVEPEAKWRVIEEFGVESITELENGKLLFEFPYTDKENLFSWILSMGDSIELLEPASFRDELGCIAKRIREKYCGKE